MRGDGDGWWFSPDGTRNWGKHGAAGLLLRAPLDDGRPGVLLQHRAVWSHQGGTWALPGGARDSHETTEHAAVREAWEEAGIDQSLIRVRAEVVTARAQGGWTYTTVIADTAEPLATSLNMESAELRWVPEDDVDTLPLHPGFELAWPSLRTTSARVVLDGIADVAVLEAALPRTVALPGEGFAWLLALELSESLHAESAQITAVITAGASAAGLVGDVFTLSVEEMFAS
ncbi:NUDIX hydrolase [Aldersonia kunmingensis]|uniref:NUDIX hydrolase n=1 Tax=Aldersonia kunmingensis TaxID=408066 RepID=UPI000833A57F|nr:NUDIX hydrolase [Aldersonia kunmingensis]